MKAIRIHTLGNLDGLRVDEVPDGAPGPGEVVVRVRAASLNYRDLLMASGRYNPRLPLPYVPLSDGAGEVVACGAGTSQFSVGDRVMAAFLSGWIDGPPTRIAAASALGGGGRGVLAEQLVVPESSLVAIPDHLSYEEAATLPCAGVTAWHALIAEGAVKPGESVLVQGTGGVSVFALQLARIAGARVIATSSGDAKLERMKALGAAHGINYKTRPDWDRAVLELTNGEGVDHVVEVGGAGTFAKSLRAVKMGGRVSLIGVLAGGAGEVELFPVLMKNVRVQGIFVGSVAMLAALARAVREHQLRPVIDRLFAFSEARAAFEHLQSGAHFGKVVIQVAP